VRTPPATPAGQRDGGTGKKLPPTERRAIEILEAQGFDWTKAEVRKAYKALIKVLHPDMNGGDRSPRRNSLQEVVWAWDQIKDSRNFAD
jgi:curved DNA-binding protein CbpA